MKTKKFIQHKILWHNVGWGWKLVLSREKRPNEQKFKKGGGNLVFVLLCVNYSTIYVLRNCVPLGVGNFKLVFEGNLLLQCKYFYFLSLHVDVSDNKNNNDCQSCVLCTLNRTDVAKWIKNGATDLWHRQHHWKECIRNFIKNHTVATHLTSDDHIKCIS